MATPTFHLTSKHCGVFAINPDKCTECVGHHDESQCVLGCPVDCIVPDPDRRETRDELLQKFHSITGAGA